MKEEKSVADMMKVLTYGFVALFFFMWIGLQADFFNKFDALLLGVLFSVLAISGKWLGAVIGMMLSRRGSFAEANLIGWGMNARGAVELVIAEIARKNGLITNEVFSAIIFMTIISMIVAPICFKLFASQYHSERPWHIFSH